MEPESFPPEFFTYLGHSTVENFDSVFLTGVRPEPGIGHFEVWPDWQISKFFPWERVFCSGSLRLRTWKFLSRIFYPFWPPQGRKFWFVFLTKVRPNRSSFQIFPLERVFRSRTLCQWSQKFPSRIFTRFGRPMAENFDSVFLTNVRPNNPFDRRVTITLSQYFRPMVQLRGGGLMIWYYLFDCEFSGFKIPSCCPFSTEHQQSQGCSTVQPQNTAHTP